MLSVFLLGAPIVYAACTALFVSVACEDMVVHCLETTTGKPTLPLISLPGSCIRLVQTPTSFLAALTTNSHVMVWNIIERKAVFKENYGHLMKDGIKTFYTSHRFLIVTDKEIIVVCKIKTFMQTVVYINLRRQTLFFIRILFILSRL